MKHAVFIVALAGLLSACDTAKTEAYYLEHPEEMKADLAECKSQNKNTYNCNEASKAAVKLNQPPK